MLKTIKKYIAGLDLHIGEVIAGASLSFAIRILGALAQLGFTVLLARIFDAEGMGIYILALSITVIASTIGHWGLDQAALKYIAVYKDQNKWREIKEIFYKAAVLVSAISIFVSVLLFLLVPWLSTFFANESQLTELLHILVLSILPFSLLNLFAECLRAIKMIGAYTLVQGFLVPFLSVGFLIAFYLLNTELKGAAYAYVLTTYVAFGIAAFLWQRSSCLKHDTTTIQQEAVSFITLLNTANPMAGVTFVSVAMSFNETLLLGIFRTSEEVGIYAAALRLALLINFVIIAFNSILAPKFAALHRQEALSSIEILAISSVRIMFFLTLPIFVVFFIFPDYLLLIFSPYFAAASGALMILAFGQLFNILAGPVGNMLLMTGHEKEMRKNVIVAAFASFSLGVVIISDFGVVGAAWASTAGMIILNCLCSWSVRKKLRIKAPLVNLLLYKK